MGFLPKIKIKPFKILGGVVKRVLPGVGDVAVGAVEQGIKIVKGTKIQLKDVTKDSGQAAVDAAAARIREELAQSAAREATPTAQNMLIPLLLGGIVVLLLVRGRR